MDSIKQLGRSAERRNLEMSERLRPRYGRYYDLIRVPHGHIPAPLTNLWSLLPVPARESRGSGFYFCPVCGGPSFFKIRYACSWCEEDLGFDDSEDWAWKRYKRKSRRDYFRELFKRIEYLFLPILILLGKAWYVRSTRRHYRDWGENLA